MRHLTVVEEWTPTADDEGRVFKLAPGERIVLDMGDQWELEEDQSALDSD